MSRWAELLGPVVSEEIEPGFQSAEEIAMETGKAAVTVRNQLVVLSRGKKVERKKFKNEDGRAVWFYRVTSP